jgi:hypothetical protein
MPWALDILFGCIGHMVAQAGSPYAAGQGVDLGAWTIADPLACPKAHWEAMRKSSNLSRTSERWVAWIISVYLEFGRKTTINCSG